MGCGRDAPAPGGSLAVRRERIEERCSAVVEKRNCPSPAASLPSVPDPSGGCVPANVWPVCDSKEGMKAALFVATLVLSACIPQSEWSRTPDATRPEVGAVGGNAVGSPKQPVRLTLAHKWARGQLTVVQLRLQDDAYVVSSRRFACRTGSSRLVKQGAERADLEQALAVLDPKSLSRDDPCHRSGRDETAWLVSTDVNRATETRARQFGARAPKECIAFQEAAEQLMALAGLTCSSTTCIRDAAASNDVLGCP